MRVGMGPPFGAKLKKLKINEEGERELGRLLVSPLQARLYHPGAKEANSRPLYHSGMDMMPRTYLIDT